KAAPKVEVVAAPKVEVVTAPATDWRKSWGKSEDVPAKLTPSVAAAKVAPVMPPPVATVQTAPVMPPPVATVPAAPVMPPPVAAVPAAPAILAIPAPADPLQKPEAYSKPTVTEITSSRPVVIKGEGEPRGMVHAVDGGQMPLGIQSVLAASNGNPEALTQL